MALKEGNQLKIQMSTEKSFYNIGMPFYQSRNSHYKDKTVLGHCSLFNGNPYTWKRCCRHSENFWALTGPRRDFCLILLISNMVINRSFNGPTHLLSANVRGQLSFAVSEDGLYIDMTAWSLPALQFFFHVQSQPMVPQRLLFPIYLRKPGRFWRRPSCRYHDWQLPWNIFLKHKDNVICTIGNPAIQMHLNGAWTKWVKFGILHLQKHFLEWKFYILIWISLKFDHKGMIDNKSTLVQEMAWCCQATTQVTWTNVDLAQWHHMTSQGYKNTDELLNLRAELWNFTCE